MAKSHNSEVAPGILGAVIAPFAQAQQVHAASAQIAGNGLPQQRLRLAWRKNADFYPLSDRGASAVNSPALGFEGG